MNVEARSGRCDGRYRVPLVGHRQQYRVEVAAADQVAEVQVCRAIAVAVPVVHYLLGPVSVVLVHVTDSHHLHFGFAQKTLHVAGPLRTDADMIGINNRDLKTLKVDLEVTKRLLEKHPAEERVIVGESGIKTVEDIHLLSKCGAKAFLIGTAIMEAVDIKEKVKELAEAL